MNDLVLQQHQALTRAAGIADLSARSQLEIRGQDRARLLHGLCTNDIKRLRVGEGCEAFLTNGQGKTIGYIYAFCEEERLVVDSVPGQTHSIIASLDRYVIREDVQFSDLGTTRRQWLIGGPASSGLLGQVIPDPLPTERYQHIGVDWQGEPLHIRRVPWTGPDCFFVSVPVAASEAWAAELLRVGAIACESEAVETARIEAGSPWYGTDLTPDTLPQEVDRPEAISFTKGCYLGQETVARIDALGHVNWLLRGLRFSGTEVPPPGAELRHDGKAVARLTSTCWSPRLQAPLGLAYVRRGHHQTGMRLGASEWGEAEVVSLPVE